MNVIILGATSIGGVLAKYLVEEGHDVHVIDPDGEAIAQLLAHVDVRTLQGHAEDPDALHEAQIHSADMVLAVTNSDSRNIVTTLGLHSMAPQARAALWVRDTQFTNNVHIWRDPQLKECIQLTPERNALNLVMDLLEIPLAFEAASFLGGRIHIAGLRLQDDSHLIGGRLSDIV
ncbi:MAG: NAD-binding protein, partial [Magnetococcales bacterium]|nr:NAD-binding protein [Magnetococcales bacterium]